MKPRVGCAGWTIGKQNSACFPQTGSHLARYSTRFDTVEINSCFYRSHKPSTYASWAGQTPPSFAFSLKVPKEITHHRRLINCEDRLARFLDETTEFGTKRGPLLVQLPPSLSFDETIAGDFFSEMRHQYGGHVVCEPRHLSWFAPAAERLLTSLEIARVAADPSVTPSAASPGGWGGLVYFRLHGSPRMYFSTYTDDHLRAQAVALLQASASSRCWCIFDNTALGAATRNALALILQLETAELNPHASIGQNY